MKLTLLRLLSVFAAVFLAGCVSTDEAKFGKTIREWVPLGTPVAQAERTLRKHGFECHRVAGDNLFNRLGVPYLACERSDSFLRTWTAQFMLTGGKVSGYGDINVEH